MTKGEKIFAVCSVAFILAAGGATAVVIANSKNSDSVLTESVEVKINADNLLTELKVGKYYLENGTDEEYIEVYPDKTICMFGLAVRNDTTDDQRKNDELFTTRQPYRLSDKTKHINLGDTPIGYGYIDENCIKFSDLHNRKLKYIYRNE